MNLDALLEAAKFLETKTGVRGAKTREPKDFHPYAKSSPHDRNTNDSPDKGSKSSSSSDDGNREKRRYGGTGTREVHNKLEKNRRAHLKYCFESLKQQIPSLEDKKTSNLSILRSSLRHIQMLKRKEREFEQEMQQLAQEKIKLQERISALKNDLSSMNIEYDLSSVLPDDDDTDSASTATADESPIMSEEEDVENEEPSPNPKPLSFSMASLPKSVSSATRLPLVTGNSTASISSIIGSVKSEPTSPTSPVVSSSDLSVYPPRPVCLVKNLSGGSVPTKAAQKAVLPIPQNFVPSSSNNVSHPAPVTTSISKLTQQNSAISSILANGPQTTVTLPITSTTVTTPSTGPQQFKTPVTQILQQTIAQRALHQQLQHQQKLQQQRLQQQLQQQQIQQQQVRQQQQPQQQPKMVQQQPSANQHVITLQTNNLQQMAQLQQLRQAVALNQMVPGMVAQGTPILTNPATISASQASAIAAFNKLVTTAVTTTEATSASSSITTSSTSNSIVTTSNGSPMTGTTAVTLANIKHIIASPTLTQIPTHLMAQPGQIPTLGQLMSQAALMTPRTSTGAMGVQQVAGSNVIMSPSVSAMHPLITHHVTPVSQLNMMSPMTLSTAALSQAQLNNVVTSPLIKSIGSIPILQQPFNYSQMVKPAMVMVTMPSVVTTSAAPAPVQLSIPVTNSS